LHFHVQLVLCSLKLYSDLTVLAFFQVAMGIPLSNIPQIRRFYNRDPYGHDKIDFVKEEYREIKNHVIAARITAENPDEGFKPTSGLIERVKFQSTPNVWGYFSVGTNGGIHEFADSQFGHLFASGPNREEARKALVLALKEIDVRGEIRNPVEYLAKLLETKEFKENNIDTSWLDGILKAKSITVKSDAKTVVTCSAVYRAMNYIKNEMKKFQDSLSKGQTAVADLKSINNFPMDIIYEDIKYQFTASRLGKDRLRLTINNQNIDVKIREQPDGSLLCMFGTQTRKVYGQEEPLGLRMVIDGSTVMMPNVFDPSELRSDVTGKVNAFPTSIQNSEALIYDHV
jgi:acetyl-CoA carboxylase/biotin carboxylase 1